MDQSSSPHSTEAPPIHGRKRTSHACDYCRHRKVRCNGRQPCATCTSAGEECLYGSNALAKSRGDMILEVALRSEKLLHELRSDLAKVATAVGPGSRYSGSPPLHQQTTSPQLAVTGIDRTAARGESIDNATISTLHDSTTESILRWPYFDDFPALRSEIRFDVFQLEQSRSHLLPRPTAHVFATTDDIDATLSLFQQNVNMWHPVICQTKLGDLRMRLITRNFDGGTECCLARLVMALGCASGIVISSCAEDGPGQTESATQRHQRALMDVYFDDALRSIQGAFVDMNTAAVQCLFYAALFYTFLQCPLQAWGFLNAAAAKCHLLLSYPGTTTLTEDTECLRRIFWSCYILESNYLAELSALPQSGLGDIESTISLPQEYDTHDDSVAKEHSSLYFLACISMRRLLNRVQTLLYDKDTGATFDDARFPSVVTELSHQLDRWRGLLPPELQFSLDTSPASNVLSGFLRQRYLTCRSVIFRPYLMWAFSHGNDNRNMAMSEAVLERCNACLEACMLHILNLRSFPHTVMIDTWICALSMASAMLVILAASRLSAFRPCIAPRALLLGPHLDQLFRRWRYIPGFSVSPSVEQSLRMILRVNDIFKEMFLRPPPQPAHVWTERMVS